jgi:perosamine synthetase
VKIPLSRVYIDDQIKKHVLAAIDSESYILTKECEAFEQELAAHTGTKHCVLSSSWTAAVHLLLLSLKLKPGDEVIVPSHTAFPSIEPIVHVGAKPIFIDVDDSYTLDVKQLESLITPRTVGIMAVHIYGHPANIDQVKAIAEKHKLFWIEDCAHAQGARYRGKQVLLLFPLKEFNRFW